MTIQEILLIVAGGAAFNGGIGLWVLKTIMGMNSRLSRIEGRLGVSPHAEG